MASSIIIKDESGQIKGYAIVEKESLLVMVKGEGENGRLYLLSGDAKKEECAVVCDGREARIPYYGEVPSFGYVVTDAVTNSAVQEEKESGPEEKKNNQCKNNSSDFVYIQEREKKPNPAAKDRMNRWPPPPCWPTARYVNGVWCESGESTPDCI